MKKLLTLGVITTLFISCNEPNIATKNTGIIINKQGTNLKEVEIDGCEYIMLNGYRMFGIAHKGNCKNPIHKHTK